MINCLQVTQFRSRATNERERLKKIFIEKSNKKKAEVSMLIIKKYILSKKMLHEIKKDIID